jgi:predicted nucleic acid-binding protein
LSGYLLDTDVLSEVIRKRPEPRVVERLRPRRLPGLAVEAWWP